MSTDTKILKHNKSKLRNIFKLLYTTTTWDLFQKCKSSGINATHMNRMKEKQHMIILISIGTSASYP